VRSVEFRLSRDRKRQFIRVLSSTKGIRKEAAVRALGDLARKFKLHRWTEKTAL